MACGVELVPSLRDWRYMNPMEWLKAAYEAFGVPHPKLSLLVVAIAGAITFGAGWMLLGHMVIRDRAAKAQTLQTVPASGAATTSGDSSPAVSGNGNTITYEQPSSDSSKKKTPPK